MSVFAVVPAAGSGRRFGADLPKQYQILAGRTVLETTLAVLLSQATIEKIVVALDPNDQQFSQIPISSDSRLQRVDGGDTRAESVFNGLKALGEIAAADDFVMVHDAARPLVSAQELQALQSAAGSHDVGAILALPLEDTLKLAKPGDGTLPIVSGTLDRSLHWRAQTPQMIRYGLLRNGLSLAIQAGESVTDEAAAVERLGFQPLLVTGSKSNLKITTPEDLALAEYILRRES